MIANPIEPIYTSRLALREYRLDDLPDLSAMLCDAVFNHYEGDPYTQEKVQERIERYLTRAAEIPRNIYRFSITLPPADRMIGYISLSLQNREIHEWEIGWGVSQAYWGQGIATEAAQAVIRFAFDHLDANRVVAFCHADNTASFRVMEKNGMRREGRLREARWLHGEKCDEFVYAVLRSDLD